MFTVPAILLVLKCYLGGGLVGKFVLPFVVHHWGAFMAGKKAVDVASSASGLHDRISQVEESLSKVHAFLNRPLSEEEKAVLRRQQGPLVSDLMAAKKEEKAPP
jgi:hypothetical protein